MVARRLPFRGKTPTDRVAVIIEREPESLGKVRRGVPAELERIVKRALAKNRGERCERATDLAEDLRRLRATLGGERPFSFGLPAPAHGLLFCRRRAIALVALLLVALGCGIWFYNRRSSTATQIDSIAVLPFANESGDDDVEHLSDGLTEALINSLSQLPKLSVKAKRARN